MTFKPRPNEREPVSPKPDTKVAFLVDARCGSYLETLMGIASHYRLGKIIGEPTAGPNGTINFTYLPGGYLVRFTGLKALKMDGSYFHGNSITLDIPVKQTISGIAAGRDEILEAAVDEISERSSETKANVENDRSG